MPKKYAIAIVPISGLLVCVAAVASIIQDSFKLRAGIYKLTKDLDSNIEEQQVYLILGKSQSGFFLK